MTQKLSSRHHYIPQFFTKGFSNDRGMLYVYNKELDKIIPNLRPPKSIFYEYDRNTILTKDLEKNSILEDFWYKVVDDKTSRVITQLRKEKITKDLQSDNNLSQLHFFIVSLFWRIPHSDFAAKDLIARAEIVTNGNITSDEIKNDPSLNKILRSKLYSETIDQCLTQKTNIVEYFSQLSEFEDDIFIIGDNPVVFEKHMGKFTDFGTTGYCLALSSNRIHFQSYEPIPNFTKGSALIYNAIVIDQSKICVAASNLKILTDSIELYKKLKNLNLLLDMKKRLFKQE